MEFYVAPPVDPVEAATNAAGTEGSRGTFNPSLLRQAFKLFLLNFSSEGDFPYKANIRRLPLLVPIGGEYGQEDQMPISSGGASSLIVELEHLAMPEWLGREDNNNNNSQDDDLTSEDGHTTKLNEVLVAAFRSYPLRSVTIGEDVIREVYLDLLPVQEREKLQRDHGTDSWAQIKAMLMAEKHPTHRIQQLQVELRVEGRPLRIRDLNAATVETLVIIHGIVIQAYRPYHKAVRLFVKCRGCSHQLTLAVPAWKGQAELPQNCVAQGGAGERCPANPYVIIPELSQFVDTQTVKIQEFPEDVPSGDMARTLMLNCSNGFAGRLIPGDHVRVVGVHSTSNSNSSRKGGSDQKSYVHVLGTEAVGGGIKERSGVKAWWNFKEEEEFQAMAKDPNILSRIFESIAPALIGLDDIKKSVACLLFGGTRKTLPDGAKLRGDVNVLLLGDPSTAKSQFLKFVEHAAPIAVYTSGKGSSAAGLTAAVVRDGNGNFALEGGAMVLADGGAVCIDEFDKMRPDDRVAIHEAMEQQTISLAKAGITAMLSSRCSVLAAANPVFGSYDVTKDTTEQHDFETTILSRFDLIWIVKDDKDPNRDATISQHIFNLHANLMTSQQNNNQNIIPLEKLRRYIKYCRSTCHPVLTSAAAKKLENFYLEVRSAARSDTRKRRDQIPITVRQLESLVRISESLAKMSLTTAVNESHVEEAIRLFKLSTVEAAKTVHISESLSDEQKEAVKQVEAQILSRLPPGARTSKITVLRDLQHRGFSQLVVVSALKALVARGVLQERGDASIRRIN